MVTARAVAADRADPAAAEDPARRGQERHRQRGAAVPVAAEPGRQPESHSGRDRPAARPQRDDLPQRRRTACAACEELAVGDARRRAGSARKPRSAVPGDSRQAGHDLPAGDGDSVPAVACVRASLGTGIEDEVGTRPGIGPPRTVFGRMARAERGVGRAVCAAFPVCAAVADGADAIASAAPPHVSAASEAVIRRQLPRFIGSYLRAAASADRNVQGLFTNCLNVQSILAEMASGGLEVDGTQRSV